MNPFQEKSACYHFFSNLSGSLTGLPVKNRYLIKGRHTSNMRYDETMRYDIRWAS